MRLVGISSGRQKYRRGPPQRFSIPFSEPEFTRRDIVKMRKETPVRYWWDYLRFRTCFGSWQKAERPE